MIIVYIFGILYDLIMQFQPLQTDESSKNNNKNIGNVLRSTLCSVVSPFWSTSYFCLFAALHFFSATLQGLCNGDGRNHNNIIDSLLLFTLTKIKHIFNTRS